MKAMKAKSKFPVLCHLHLSRQHIMITSVSLYWQSVSSQNKRKFNTGRHVLTLLSYTLNAIWKCPRWRHMHTLECYNFCDVYTTLNHDLSENYLFRKVPIEHLRRVWIADRDTHSSGQLTRPIWGLHNLLRPFPAKLWTLGLNLLRYSIWHIKAILCCKSSCIDSWLSLT